MRQIFQNYFPLPESFYDYLWGEAIIAVDANVLLDMYRYAENARNDMFVTLKKFSDRLWIPHQAAFEFARRRPDVIHEQIDRYDKVIKMLDDLKNTVRSEVKKSLGSHKHPILDKEKLYKEIERPINKLRTNIKRSLEDHPNFRHNDPILEEILCLFDGRVDPGYDDQRLQEIYKQGEERYKKKIPPGYKDAEGARRKEGDNIYGDLIIWNQMIDKAKEIKKPIMFITNDTKEDWWWYSKGKRLGCCPELREEMQRESGYDFYLYTSEMFLKYASERLNAEINEDTIVEVRSVQEEDEQYYAKQKQQSVDSIRKNIATIRKELERSTRTVFGSQIDQSAFDQFIKQQEERQRLADEAHQRINEVFRTLNIDKSAFDQFIKQQEERQRLAREIVNSYPFLSQFPQISTESSENSDE